MLESPRLRLIVSPADGGRVLALVDKATNDDLIILGGALHDFIVPAGALSTEAMAAGDFSFNRAYKAEWIAEKQNTSLRLAYSEFENSVAGIHVEKTLRLAEPETVEASYLVSFTPSAFPSQPGNAGAAQSLISMLSVPVQITEDGNTRFCWDVFVAPAFCSNACDEVRYNAAGPDSHCEDFVSSSPPIAIPDGIMRVKILSHDRPTLAVEWTSGQMIVVPRSMSADLRLRVPVPSSAETPAEFTLRYTIESGP